MKVWLPKYGTVLPGLPEFNEGLLYCERANEADINKNFKKVSIKKSNTRYNQKICRNKKINLQNRKDGFIIQTMKKK